MKRLLIFGPAAMALLINGVPATAQQGTRGSNPGAPSAQKDQDDMQKRTEEQKKIIAE
jgi:hypothetical protein